MNNKSKSILALLGTLFIGMVLGALFTGVIVRSKMKGMHDPEVRLKYLQSRIYDWTNANSEQKVKINEVLDRNSIILMEIESDFRKKRRETMDLIVRELEPVLDKEQNENVREKLSKVRANGRKGFRK